MSDTNIDERIDEILEELQDNSATDDLSHDWDADRTEAKAQIKQLITEARIDELNRFHLFRTDDGSNERYKHERLAVLRER